MTRVLTIMFPFLHQRVFGLQSRFKSADAASNTLSFLVDLTSEAVPVFLVLLFLSILMRYIRSRSRVPRANSSGRKMEETLTVLQAQVLDLRDRHRVMREQFRGDLDAFWCLHLTELQELEEYNQLRSLRAARIERKMVRKCDIIREQVKAIKTEMRQMRTSTHLDSIGRLDKTVYPQHCSLSSNSSPPISGPF